ncbi:MAG: hypothetical protein PHC85_03315 [Candidatus Pacebacteria bacterium]|nr:hypothetical protein [Candidatus Paceibacterota bacterium]
MRNKTESKISRIISLARVLPYFSMDNLSAAEKNRNYLKTLFSRYSKAGKIIRIKKGLYVAKDYIEESKKTGNFSAYLEFLAHIMRQPSYLSMDYILYNYNILTEVPASYTIVTKKKTANFFNEFGNFLYHSIRKDLFCGFKETRHGKLIVFKATKAKAFFDFLYFRKNSLVNEESVKELRLNLGEFNKADKKELEGYIKLEGSGKMKQIFNHLFT